MSAEHTLRAKARREKKELGGMKRDGGSMAKGAGCSAEVKNNECQQLRGGANAAGGAVG